MVPIIIDPPAKAKSRGLASIQTSQGVQHGRKHNPVVHDNSFAAD
jgi:hypothetical protein